jgi:hypothetical protein
MDVTALSDAELLDVLAERQAAREDKLERSREKRTVWVECPACDGRGRFKVLALQRWETCLLCFGARKVQARLLPEEQRKRREEPALVMTA